MKKCFLIFLSVSMLCLVNLAEAGPMKKKKGKASAGTTVTTGQKKGKAASIKTITTGQWTYAIGGGRPFKQAVDVARTNLGVNNSAFMQFMDGLFKRLEKDKKPALTRVKAPEKKGSESTLSKEEKEELINKMFPDGGVEGGIDWSKMG